MSNLSSLSGLNLNAGQNHPPAKPPQAPTSSGPQSLSESYSQVAQKALKTKK